MKRKITELEKLMIDNGWILFYKTYTGKYAKRVSSYVYKRNGISVSLNPKRNDYISIEIPNEKCIVNANDIKTLTEIYVDTQSELEHYKELLRLE